MFRPRQRWLVAGLVAALPAVLALGFGHRGTHAAQSMLVPGAGLLETHPVLAAACFLLAVGVIVTWLRWGADWMVVGVVAATMVVSAALADVHHGPAESVARAAHEFPLVVLVIGLLATARVVLGRIPGFGWLAGRRVTSDHEGRLEDLPPTDRCRAVAIQALAGPVDSASRAAVLTPDVVQRARRIGFAARFRRGGDPFRVDHAHVRAALALTGDLDAGAGERFAADARRTGAGVPASEPTWVRTLDATLAAVALDESGEHDAAHHWRRMLAGSMALRRGHRPAWWWTPLGVAMGRCLDWEHAAATAIARSRGWVGDDDWAALRRRVLGAAARGSSRRDDERLIAAGRVWLALVEDPTAERIVSRPTVRHDPLAVALDGLARHLRTAPVPAVRGTSR